MKGKDFNMDKEIFTNTPTHKITSDLKPASASDNKPPSGQSHPSEQNDNDSKMNSKEFTVSHSKYRVVNNEWNSGTGFWPGKSLKRSFITSIIISLLLLSGCKSLGKDGLPKEGVVTSAGTLAGNTDTLKSTSGENNGTGKDNNPDEKGSNYDKENGSGTKSDSDKSAVNQNDTDNEGVVGSGEKNGDNSDNKNGVDNNGDNLKKRIVCEIKGEVLNPGVYNLKEGDRVNDIIVMAGGLTEDSSLDFINRASYLYDGQSVIIPYRNMSREEYDCLMALGAEDKSRATQENEKDQGINPGDAKNKNAEEFPGEKNNGQSNKTDALTKASEKQGNKDTGDNKININTADSSELEKIPGVGPKTAEKIITYRETIAPFATIEEIKNVDRIGDKTFIKMQPYITVD